MSKVPIIGLTGPTGAGKSTVSKALAEEGCAIIDADQVAREVVRPGSPCVGELAAVFGEDIKTPEGGILRGLLAQRAFSSMENTQKLNEITHPWITRTIREKIEEFTRADAAVLVLDAPLLYESGEDALCDRVVAVLAPEEARLSRIMERDGISREAALARMKAQNGESFYTSRADYVLRNEGRPTDLYQQTICLLKQIREELDVPRS